MLIRCVLALVGRKVSLNERQFPCIDQDDSGNANHSFYVCPESTEYYDANNKTLPTVEEFNDIWAVAWEDPPEEGASEEIKASYKKRRANLTWYVENWLQRCVDDTWYGAGHRPQERLTKLITVDGTDRERVSATREAYGFIQFENSRECWLAKFKWDDDQDVIKKTTGVRKKKPAPNYSHKDLSTKQFKSKWSDHSQGRQSKWDPVVYTELDLKIAKVEKWREEDKKKNYKGQDFAMKLSRECQGIEEVEQEKSTSSQNKKKRGRGKDSGDEDHVPPPKPKGYVYRIH